MPVTALLRSLTVPLVAAGSLAAASAAVAAPAPPAAACAHKVVQPFGLNALTDKHASALAKLTPRRGCGTAVLPGMAGSTAASPKAGVPGATVPGTIPGIPDPRASGPAAAGRKGLSPSAARSNVISPRQDLAKTNMFNAVDATSATDAWAVGATFSSTGGAPLIEHWDGSTWRIVPSPNPSPAGLSELLSVTAVSATNAWAVGTFEDGTGNLVALTEHWDGAQWTVVPAASLFPDENLLLSVSAVSGTDVWAVGYSQHAADGTIRTLIEHWDGSSWNFSTPAVWLSSVTELFSVTAVSATSAIAVGTWIDSSGNAETLTERWDGTQWRNLPFSNVGTDSEFFSVTATSPTDAWAVGLTDDSTGVTQPLIEHYDGGFWTVVTSPAISPSFEELRSVTATSATNAWAVGDFENASGAAVTVAEHWNGTRWSVATTPNLGNFDQFNGVIATSANDAWAVGVTDGALGAEETLAEHWNGTAWRVVASPNDGIHSNLFSVAATSATNAWAVGSFLTSAGTENTLAEHWDGTSWSAVPTPNNSSSNVLFSVTATSATNAWAVGTTEVSGAPLLVEHWNGTAWTIVGVPIPAGAVASLVSVKATSATNAWAVGQFQDSAGITRPLAEHWDGTSWSIVPTPDTGGFGNFDSVTATSATNAWAVGLTVSSSGSGDRPLVEHWNGANWTINHVPDPGQTSLLTSVTATSTTNALATGFSGFPQSQQLAERWNGVVWSPTPATSVSVTPFGVAATSATDAWAVGGVNGGPQQPMTEHWNGTSWTNVPLTNPLPFMFLQGVAATSTTNAWAVGNYFLGPSSSDDGLGAAIVHWNGTTWSPVPSPLTA